MAINSCMYFMVSKIAVRYWISSYSLMLIETLDLILIVIKVVVSLPWHDYPSH